MHDYVLGKVDWIARALPLEGEKADQRRAIDFARHDVVTCGLHDTAGDVRARVAESPYGFAFVLADGEILLGRLRRGALEDDPAARVQDVMEPGPSTGRPDTPPAELREKLRRADLKTAVLTDPEGRLLGVVFGDDLPAA